MKVTREFVINELSKVSQLKESNNQAQILCPFHEDVKTPSLSISLGGKTPPGIFFCFGCQEKGSWNKLAAKLGLRQVDKDYLQDDEAVLSSVKIEEFNPYMDLSLSPLNKPWRKYSIDFLNQFEAKLMWHDKYHDSYLYFPFYYLHDYKGFIRVKLNNESIGPKTWFHLDKGGKLLYPMDYLLSFETPVIVLVEGIADVFRLLKHRIPALALLGTYTLLDNIKIMLDTLLVKRVILCCDGDSAGRNANFKIAKELESIGIDARIFPLPDNEDPDSVHKEYIKALRNMVIRIGGKLLR